MRWLWRWRRRLALAALLFDVAYRLLWREKVRAKLGMVEVRLVPKAAAEIRIAP